MSGNPGYVCWGWSNARHEPRRLTKARRAGGEVQIEAMWRWSPRAFQLRRVGETQRFLWHFFFECYNVAVLQKGCHLGQMLVNCMIWEMILPEEKGYFTVSDSWVRPFPRRFQCRVVFLLRLIWACCSDHGTSAVLSSTSSTMTAGVCESLAGCCV